MEKWVLSLLVFIVVPNVFAADHYVRPDGGNYGSEDGSDWNNAFNGFTDINWASINPGDVVWLAGGTYTQELNPEASGLSELRIFIKRAIKSDDLCSSAAGWTDNFDSQVQLNDVGINFNGDNHITIDGQVKNGIRIFRPTRGTQGVNWIAASSYITIRNFQVEGPGYDLVYNQYGSRGIDVTPSSGTSTNIVIEYCDIFNQPTQIYFFRVYDSIVQYCELHHGSDATPPPNDDHENVLYSSVSHNITFRYNVIHDWTAMGVFLSGNQNNWHVYGNTFYDGWVGVEGRTGSTHHNLNIYNNIFDEVYGPVRYRGDGDTGKTKNNIFYGGTQANIWGDSDHDYNWFSGTGNNGETHGIAGGSETPFVDRAIKDYHLKSGSSTIDSGTNLGSQYEFDPDGNTRGADGVWDRGAYEFGGAPPASCIDQGFYCCPSGSTCSSPRSGSGCGSGTCCATAGECNTGPVCGNGDCETGENCDSCASDCLDNGEVCCLGVVHTGDCCDESDCSGSDTCQDYVCIGSDPTCRSEGYQCCDSCSPGTEQLAFDADCSEQVCCGQCENPINLISSATMITNSVNFEPDHPIEHLWDGCLDGTPECTAGSSTQDSFWIEIDLGEPHSLTRIRLFGDDIDQWVSTNWEMQYKMLPEDDWSTAFSGVDAFFSDWSTEILDIDARIVRISVYSDTGSVQAREIELQGILIGCVPMILSELISEIDEWKSGTKNLNEVMQTIVEWKNGC